MLSNLKRSLTGLYGRCKDLAGRSKILTACRQRLLAYYQYLAARYQGLSEPRRKYVRMAAVGVALLLVLLLTRWILMSGGSTDRSNEQVAVVAPPPAITTEAADEAGPTVLVDGVVKPFMAVTLSASLREIIRSIDVAEGDRITEGQVLIRLESEKQRLAVERYELMIAKATFDQQAAQRLFEQNVASRDDALNKEMELKRLQAEQGIAKVDLAQREIRSPLNGVVVHKLKEAGESVSEVEPILHVMETDRLLLLFYLDADMLSAVKVGLELETTYPELASGTVKKAVVDFIDPEVDARSGLFRVRLLLDNKDEAIKPGMRVQAKFPTLAAGETSLSGGS